MAEKPHTHVSRLSCLFTLWFRQSSWVTDIEVFDLEIAVAFFECVQLTVTAPDVPPPPSVMPKDKSCFLSCVQLKLNVVAHSSLRQRAFIMHIHPLRLSVCLGMSTAVQKWSIKMRRVTWVVDLSVVSFFLLAQKKVVKCHTLRGLSPKHLPYSFCPQNAYNLIPLNVVTWDLRALIACTQ